MTVSANCAFDPKRDEIIKGGLLKCGVLHAQQTPSADQIALGYTLLQPWLVELQNRGVLLHAVERYTQPLTAGVASIVAPPDTISVEKTATVRDGSNQDFQIEIAGNVDMYQSIVDKSVLGRPSLYYPEKGPTGTWTIYLWPVPMTGYVSITYTRTRKVRDTETGDMSLDIPPKFSNAAMLYLASEFASHFKRSEALVLRLAQQAETSLQRALDTETLTGNVVFVAPTLCGGDW